MTPATAVAATPPKDERTGLTLPLSRSLASQDLAKHRALVALEMEVIAKKHDRFGWERDRGSAAHDRILLDWMDALQDFPIEEVRAACRQAVIDNPSKTPNEGHVRAQIMAERARVVARNRRPSAVEPPQNWTREESEAYQARVALDNINPERKAAADAILKSAGFNLSMSAGDA
jgi:hypothetical protein